MITVKYELQKAIFTELFKVLIDSKKNQEPKMQKIDPSFMINFAELLNMSKSAIPEQTYETILRHAFAELLG